MSPTEEATAAPSTERGTPAPKHRPAFRTQLALTVSLAVAVPLLAAGAAGTWLLARREDQGAARGLRNAALALSQEVNARLGEHLRAVIATARAIEDNGGFGGAAPAAALARTRAVYPGFLTMLAADSAGRVVAADPPTDSAGRDIVRLSPGVTDREYFRQPMSSGRPFVSDAFRGRTFGADPIVAVSAPVRGRDGRPIGIVEGSLDLPRFEVLRRIASRATLGVIILDARDVVVHATGSTDHDALQPLADHPLGRARREAPDGVFRYTGPGSGGERYLAASIALGAAGWHLVVRQPARVVRAATRNFIWAVALILATGLFVGAGLAVAIAHQATRPIEQLEVAVRGFLDGRPAPPVRVGPGTPREVADLVAEAEEMSRRLGRTLSGLLPVCAWCKRICDEGGNWQTIESYVQGHTSAAFTHGICPDCDARL